MILAQTIIPWRQNKHSRSWRAVVFRVTAVVDGSDRGKLIWILDHCPGWWHTGWNTAAGKRLARKDLLPGVPYFTRTAIGHNFRVLPGHAAKVSGINKAVAMDWVQDNY